LRIKLKNILLIWTINVFITILNFGCNVPYFIRQRAQHKIQTAYLIDQELHLSDIFLCSDYRKESIFKSDIQTVEIHVDSVLQIIQTAFSSLPIRIRYAEHIQHHCDSTIRENHHLKIQQIDEEALIQLAEVSGADVVLIPIFYLGTSDMMFIGPSRSANGNSRSHFISSVVYLIQDSEIIYSRKVVLAPRGQDIDQWDPDPQTPITQEHWNELVYRLMQKYLERRKN